MLVDALMPASDPQVVTGSFNWTLSAQYSNDENVVVIHDSVIANQYYQSLCQNFTDMGGMPCSADPCPDEPTVFTSTLRGSVYKWQVNTGMGFTDLSDNVSYSGTTTPDLFINNAPTAWYGNQYRCRVDGNFSDTITLKFTCYWTGHSSSYWEDPANWNCGKLPDANTDVIINNGVTFFPVVHSANSCRSISLRPGTYLSVLAGINLVLTGQ